MKRTHQAIFLALMMATMSLAGCFGDDDGQIQDLNNLDDWEVYYVESNNNLPECDNSILGRLYFIADTNSFEYCAMAGWTSIDIKGDMGPTGPQGPAGPQGANGLDADESYINDLEVQIQQLESELENATSCQLVPYGNCRGANLSGMNLSGMNLNGIDLRNAILHNVNLSNAIITNADLLGIDIRNSNLDFANFAKSILSHATIFESSVNNTRFSGADLQNAFISRSSLTRAQFGYEGWADSYGMAYPQSKLNSLDLYLNTIVDVSFRDCDMRNANVQVNQFTDVNLSGANLMNAFLSRNVWINADFTNSNLAYTELNYVIGGYNSQGGLDDGVILSGANLENAWLGSSYNSTSGSWGWCRIQSGGECQYQNLSGLDLSNLDLSGINFTGANLTNTDLSFSILYNSNFSHSKLKQADFALARIDGANFEGAQFENTRWIDGWDYSLD